MKKYHVQFVEKCLVSEGYHDTCFQNMAKILTENTSARPVEKVFLQNKVYKIIQMSTQEKDHICVNTVAILFQAMELIECMSE